MRVLIVCDWFLKYACAQATALADVGHEVALLCRDHALEFNGSQDERRLSFEPARRAGVRIWQLEGRQRSPSALRDAHRIASSIIRWQPSVVHAHDGADPRFLWMTRGFPLVLTVHDVDLHPGQRETRGYFKHVAAQRLSQTWRARATCTIVHGPRLQRAYQARYPSARTHAIPHGLDCAAEPLRPPPVPTVALLGRLEEYKGVSVFDGALPRIWRSRPDVRAIVAGRGAHSPTIQDHRLELHLGYFRDDEVEALLARTSLVTLPYVEASMSGIGSLAVSYGVPVVVSDRGDLPELVLNGSWVITEPRPQALADAVFRHIDHDVGLRRKLLAEVAAPRDWTVLAGRSTEVYEEAARLGRR